MLLVGCAAGNWRKGVGLILGEIRGGGECLGWFCAEGGLDARYIDDASVRGLPRLLLRGEDLKALYFREEPA